MLSVVIDLWSNTRWDDVIVATAAVLTAGTVIWRTAIRPVVDAFNSAAKAWQWIEVQLQPDSGESLRDKIDALTDALVVIQAQLEPVPSLLERVSAIEVVLRDLRPTEGAL